MYRDDPLDDEFELRALVGDDAIDALQLTAADPLAATEMALDVLRLLQGWADDVVVAGWMLRSQRRLGERSPLDVLAAGEHDEVHDAARAWIAARS